MPEKKDFDQPVQGLGFVFSGQYQQEDDSREEQDPADAIG